MTAILASERILLVEDEALVALDAEDALIEAGYVVIGPAGRLGAALELARSVQFDAAVLDVNLDGDLIWPVADILIERKIPFVLLSGFGNDMKYPACCKRAPRLAKPLRRDELAEALASLLARVKPASHRVSLSNQLASPGQS